MINQSFCFACMEHWHSCPQTGSGFYSICPEIKHLLLVKKCSFPFNIDVQTFTEVVFLQNAAYGFEKHLFFPFFIFVSFVDFTPVKLMPVKHNFNLLR